MSKHYEIYGRHNNGTEVPLFKDRRTYKSKRRAERWMAEMQEVVDAELFIKEIEVPAQPDLAPGILKSIEMLRELSKTIPCDTAVWNSTNWLHSEAVKKGWIKE